MSLIVSAQLASQAAHGAVTEAEFMECIEKSLPLAYDLVHRLAHDVVNPTKAFQGFIVFDGKPDENDLREQLVRMFASNAMRGAVERFMSAHADRSLRFGFVNCCKVVVYADDVQSDKDTDDTSDRAEKKTRGKRPSFDDLTGPAAQIMNQRAGMQHC